MKTSDLFESITNRIIIGLQEGTIPWKNQLREGFPSLPTNLISGNFYSGINVLLLSMNDFSSPYWCTYNQANSAGGTIKSGSQATPIVFWEIRVSNKITKEFIDQETYLSLDKNEKSNYQVRPIGRYYNLFNTDQVEGLHLPEPARSLPLNHRLEECEKIVAGYVDRPNIVFKPGIPHYAPAVDEIRMPTLDCYKNSEAFYSILFHELAYPNYFIILTFLLKLSYTDILSIKS